MANIIRTYRTECVPRLVAGTTTYDSVPEYIRNMTREELLSLRDANGPNQTSYVIGHEATEYSIADLLAVLYARTSNRT